MEPDRLGLATCGVVGVAYFDVYSVSDKSLLRRGCFITRPCLGNVALSGRHCDVWIADDTDNGGWGAFALRFVEGQCVRQFRIPLEIEGGEMRRDLRVMHVTQCLKGGRAVFAK